MEISAEKTKLLTNNTSVISTEIKVNGQKLETATRFKYLGSVITDEDQVPKRKLETATRFKYLGSVITDLVSKRVLPRANYCGIKLAATAQRGNSL